MVLDLILCGVQDGTVFEAGAQSPHEISNSKRFIEAGWNSILVEAEPIIARTGDVCE